MGRRAIARVEIVVSISMFSGATRSRRTKTVGPACPLHLCLDLPTVSSAFLVLGGFLFTPQRPLPSSEFDQVRDITRQTEMHRGAVGPAAVLAEGSVGRIWVAPTSGDWGTGGEIGAVLLGKSNATYRWHLDSAHQFCANYES